MDCVSSPCVPARGRSADANGLVCVCLSDSYILLRPFLEDVPSAEFPGAVPGTGQDVNAKWHKTLVDAAMSVPRVRPGDTVWWHCDTIHAVEPKHGGEGDSSVFYIPSVPMCPANARYLARQRAAFEAGKTPPDFPQNHGEVMERLLHHCAALREQSNELLLQLSIVVVSSCDWCWQVSYQGRATSDDLNTDGRRMMGLEPLAPGSDAPHLKELYAEANRLLGFST